MPETTLAPGNSRTIGVDADPTEVAYSRVGGFGLVNLDLDWQVSEQASLVFGLRNAFDKNYALVEGYPEAGRSMFITSRLTF